MATKPPTAGRSIFWRLRRVAYLALLLLITSVTGFGMALSRIELPPETRPVQSSFICSIHEAGPGQCSADTAIAKLSAEEDRILVSFEDLPQVLINAVVAAEDRDFFDHNGVDPAAIGRALYRDIRSDGSLQGGSTITQQYVKNAFLTSDRTLWRKLREAVLAVKLERELGKEEILERYLNEIYFGRGAYGVEAASRAYFGIPVGQLQLWQAAYLAGLIRAPERADATRDPEEADRRRSVVLAAMVEEGYVTAEEAEAAEEVQWIDLIAQPDGSILTVNNVLPRVVEDASGDIAGSWSDIGAEYIVDAIHAELDERFGSGAVYTQGLRVFTTIDRSSQSAAMETIRSTLPDPADPVASIVAIDRAGNIRAMIGGTDYSQSQVNLALGAAGGGSGRQPGSSFKPIVLAEFLRDGYSIRSVFDSPGEITLDLPDGSEWELSNYGGADQGSLTVERATWKSSNTVYAQMMLEAGIGDVATLSNQLGVTAEVPAVPSISLGSPEVSVLDMASVFSTFANHGVHIRPHLIARVEDAEGNLLYDAASDALPQAVLDPEVADTVTDVLEGVVEDGTGGPANLSGLPAAGKTGTTSDNKDAWFVGYTCELTAAVWMGYRDPAPMENIHGVASVTGGTIPAEMWHDFMTEATDRLGIGECELGDGSDGGEVIRGDDAEGDGSGTTTTTTTVPESTTTVVDPSATTAPAATTPTSPTTTTTTPAVTVPTLPGGPPAGTPAGTPAAQPP